jgi:hypothetical protein
LETKLPNFFRWNEVSVDKEGTWLCLDSTLSFFTVIRFVHTFVKGYNELFQALEIEGNVLLLGPLLDFGFDVVRWKLPTSKMFLYLKYF